MSTYGTEGKTATILLDTVTDFSQSMRVPTDHLRSVACGLLFLFTLQSKIKADILSFLKNKE